MAIASIIHNTVRTTQTIFSQIVKSLVLAPPSTAHVLTSHQTHQSFGAMLQQVPQIDSSNLGDLQLISRQTIQNNTAKRHKKAGYAVKVFKDTQEHQTGRLALTGRMSDVCAELERMVAYEALHQAKQQSLWH